jgi:phage recombination protein Bet
MSGDLVQQQGGAIVPLNDPEYVELIRNKFANGCTDSEFRLFLHLAEKYRLDPAVHEIWAVKRSETQPAVIFAGLNGYIAIAHRSGMFDGMESGTEEIDGELVGWAKVYRKDMSHPITSRVYFSEYEQKTKSGNPTLWQTKPRVMIEKVAKVQALRMAFVISGLYSPEEIDTGEPHVATPAQVREIPKPSPTCCVVCGCEVSEDIREKTRPYTDQVMCIEHFQAWWAEHKKEGGEQ